MDNLAKIAKLRESVEKAQRELRYTEDHQKMIARQIRELTRRERTNRLCTRAGMLESFLRHPEALSNDQVMDCSRPHSVSRQCSSFWHKCWKMPTIRTLDFRQGRNYTPVPGRLRSPKGEGDVRASPHKNRGSRLPLRQRRCLPYL